MIGRISSRNIFNTFILLFVSVAFLAVAYHYSGSTYFQNLSDQGNIALAKIRLSAAVLAVDVYASQKGSYAGLDAEGMSVIDSKTKWTDGEPVEDEVGISGVARDSFVLTYKEKDGAMFWATKERGKLTITDANGNQI